ncbi:(2Fe-2S) ferredoxin domain-containing protein [Variovorax sp. KBW07]|uniref:(2Fe-2S) ferredoxin domain-containing protein n=1 Tax=Variovorax sp. KBW07 TaxID=2153358 RepID=UPI000F58D981|nr:(2Fe-2S) ferredoxin domain-containing protein [Variovorax sp. KBW07]
MSHSPPLVETRLSGVVLVCGDCEERGDGPTKLKARQVRKELRRDLVHLPGRLRVVQSSCLGLCPKKAMALVAVAGGQAPLAAEVCRDEDVEAFAKALARSVR